MGEGGQKAQTSRNKISSKPWSHRAHHGDYS